MHFKYKESGINFFLLVSFSIEFCTGAAIDVDERFSLTSEQKLALEKLKKSVSNKLPHEYMKRDIYMLRWLKARDFDAFRAEQYLLQNIKWREDHKMDTIVDEDWSDMEQEYPYSLESRDKSGRPVFIGQFGLWDLRNADVTGRFPRMSRFADRLFEQEEILVRNLQEEGKKVYGVIVILDMDGFNFRQHACPKCINFVLDFYNSFEEHHPGMLEKLFIVNNYPVVNMAFTSVLHKFHPKTRNTAQLFSKNKDEYSKVLLRYIDADQLPVKLGGSKKP